MARTGARVLIDNEAFSLCYYPRTKIVHHELRRFVQGDDLRQVLEKGLEVFIRQNAKKWLSDDRGNGPLTPADAEWCLSSWSPRVMAAGWKFWAVVLPEKVMGQMNMRRWIQLYADKGVTTLAFSDPNDAMMWLEEQRVR